MNIFGNKNNKEQVEELTEIERKFEEAGRKVGKTTGKAAQKGADALQKVKANLEESGTLDKVREVGDKVSDLATEQIRKVEDAIKDALSSAAKKDKEKDE